MTKTPAPPVPSARRSTGFLLVYALANAGGVIGYLPLLTLLLPMRIEEVAGPARLGVLATTVIAGAIAASASNILFGWLSDRPARPGLPPPRRAWIAAGVAATALAYAGVIAAASPLAIVVAIMVFQVALNAALAPLLAIMADEVPDVQKGVAAGLLALGQPAAALVSAALMRLPASGGAVRLALLPGVVAVCVAPLLLTRPVPVAPAGPVVPATGRPPARDLAVAWSARLLVQVAGNVLFLYLLYFLEGLAPGASPASLARRAGDLQLVAYLLPLPVAIAIGRASDRRERRKPFLVAGAVVASAGLVAMALASDWWTGAAGFVAYTVGSAVFLSLHAAYAMQLLPDPRHRGRDLGLLNLTNTLPALVGPALAWWLATLRDFRPLLLVLAAVTLAGGLTTLAIRTRR